MRTSILALLLLLAPVALLRGQSSLIVQYGAVCDTMITAAFLKGLPLHEARIMAHDGSEASYGGAWLVDVLRSSCPAIAAMDKRTMVNSAVRVEASDGYHALIALTETDSSFRARPVLLAWMRDGRPLDEKDGPLQLIVPDDLRHARDVRMVKRVEVITP